MDGLSGVPGEDVRSHVELVNRPPVERAQIRNLSMEVMSVMETKTNQRHVTLVLNVQVQAYYLARYT